MENKIGELKNHFILCGLGRVGGEIARTFKDEGVPFIVIDNRDACIARAEQAGYLYVQGDATSDNVLKKAGIEQARGLIAAIGSDVDNTYITLSARGLRPDLFIEARASDEEAEKKLKSAGADRVVSPNNIGGRRMAMLAIRPDVIDFIDTIAYRRGRELQLEDIEIERDSSLVGLTVKQARDKTNVAVLAMQKKDGKLIPNPSDEELIEEGERLIVIGTKKRMAALETS
jgi:voltage-gated potassium channel